MPLLPSIHNPHDRPSELQAREMLALRELARRNYRDFLKYWCVATNQPLQWTWFHDYIADVMQSITARQRRRVIVNIPPRHLKSTLISQAWHAWMIGQDDSANSALMSLAATATLAARDSRRTINLLRGEWYQNLFPDVHLTRENEVEWETQGGAYRIAVGRGGTVTGRGGAHITVDDLILADEANSETIRESANEWLGETLASRLNDPKTGTITIIMQRFHERDPTGFLLQRSKDYGADQYEHIVLPLEAPKKTTVTLDGKLYATRNPGDLLHPLRIGPKEVLALKAAMRANFEGQYQQNPIKQAGGMLDPGKLIKIESTSSELIQRFGLRPNAYLDFATREKQTQKDDPDYSTILAASKDQLGRIFFLDLFRRQCDYETLGRTLIGMYKAYNFRAVKGEKGGLINTFLPMLIMQQRQTGTFFPLHPYKGPSSNGDKVARSASFQGMLNAGMICVPAHAPWLPALESEMRSFPNGAHDDMCLTSDTCVLSYNGWKRITKITTADLVLTRQGWKRVLWSGQTGNTPTITRYGLSGTPNHPVWTENRGWVPLESLSLLDRVVRVGSPSFFLGVRTIGTQSLHESNCGGTFTPTTNGRLLRVLYTVMSGLHCAARSLMVGMSTICTGLTIIAQKPWSACLRLHTASDISAKQMHSANTSEIGGDSTPKLKAWSRSSKAGWLKRLKRSLEEKRRAYKGHNPISYPRFAPTVAPASHTITPGGLKLHAPQNAENTCAICAGTILAEQPVYNLCIEDAHEFFANGILVHNCDVASMSCNDSLDLQMGEAPIKMPDDERILMDTEHKADLERRIERMRSQTGDCTEDHDW